MGRLDSRVAVVTGSASGLGSAIVAGMVAEGATVVGTDVRVDAGTEGAERLGERAHFAELDVSDESMWHALVMDVTDEHGPIDVLVNNAAIIHIGAAATLAFDDFANVLRINVGGVFLGVRAVLPGMLERGSGSIINVSSVDGIRGMPNMSAYSASKHAVIGLTRSVSAEVGQWGIRVNALCPGAMATPMLAGTELDVLGTDPAALVANIPFRRPAQPAEVANVAVFLASDEASYCSGAEFVVDGAWTGSITIG